MTVWDQVLARVETKVNRHSFSTWFRRTAFVNDLGDRVVIQVPDTRVSGLAAEALLGRAGGLIG